jgi:conjugative relaxase-like TrwC/TraI family protein
MLSIGKLTGDRVGYYERQVAQGRDDYYSGKGEAAGEWEGDGAEALGLAGEVTSVEFERLMAGNHPETAKPLRDSRQERSIVAYDLTFSAPKSVSVLYATADEETSRALRDAHDEAVRAALGYLEDEACKVRRGHGGVEIHEAEGFVSAAYRHRMSRAQDPQLHTHVVTANLAKGPDGRWTGLWGSPLYQNAQAAGYLYQAHLRAAVRERLPWVRWTDPVKGAAEIEGLPDQVLREFSKRRIEIEEWLEREGRAGRQSAEKATLATRRAKEHEIDTASWREEVRAVAAEHGLGREEIEALKGRERSPSEPVDDDGLGRRLSGEFGLTAMRNTFGSRDVVIEVAGTHRDGIDVAAAREKVRGYLGRGEVVHAADEGAESRYTTEDLLAHERKIVASAERRRGEGAPTVNAELVDRVLVDRAVPLNEEQRGAVLGIARSGHGVETVEALAGTGKTTLAGALRDVYEAAGVRVLGAARALGERAGIANAQTLTRLRLDLENYGGFGAAPAVLILDEASMASTRDTAAIIAIAEEARVKVVAIGDSGQLPSVQAGGWFGSLARRFEAHRLSEVMRQRDPTERRLLARLHGGEPAAWVRHKLETGELRVFASAKEAEAAAIDDWWGVQASLPYGQAVMTSRDNARRERLNAAARDRLREEGRLGEAVEHGGREFAVGDRVIARRNDKGHDLDNGMRGTVRVIDRETGALVVETDASGVRELPPSYVSEHLQHAYALTGHGGQGATFEANAVIGAAEEFSKNWGYTAGSRARGATRVYVIDEPSERELARAEVAPEQRPDDRADPIVRLERRLRVRDDEDLALDYLAPPAVPGDLAAERGIEPQEAGAARLVAELQPPRSIESMRRELAELDARLATFPFEEERRLDRVRASREQASRETEAAREKLRSFEARGETREHALARQSLEQAERRLTAATKRERELAARVPDRLAWERETEPLHQRRERLRPVFDERCREWVEVAIASPGTHLIEALGHRPAEARGARRWTKAARIVEDYRIRNGVTGPEPLGPKPPDRVTALKWRESQRALQAAQRQLGRSVARDLGRAL